LLPNHKKLLNDQENSPINAYIQTKIRAQGLVRIGEIRNIVSQNLGNDGRHWLILFDEVMFNVIDGIPMEEKRVW
jgi:hypothetical protein